MKSFSYFFFLALFAQLLLPVALFAQWSSDPLINLKISTDAGAYTYRAMVNDGAGGTIVTWYDYRSATDYDIYAQRLNAAGVPMWTPGGVVICAAGSQQYSPFIASDGSGGAIITWYDYRSGTNYDIYAQRVNSSGAVQWTANGVAICTAGSDQSSSKIVADGSGGAIITWNDYRSGTNTDVYAQRVNSSGVVQWATDGVAISTAGGDQSGPSIVSDGSGGAIVSWYDYRSLTSYDVYAQRVDASGAVQWTTDGVAICAFGDAQYLSGMISDGSGGAVITWYDYRSGTYFDIYAQKVNSSGTVQWAANGVAICTATNSQYSPSIVSDGSGGAIITWYDYRSATSNDIYAQRVGASGTVQWAANGVAICTAGNSQYTPDIAADGLGGAIIVWYDYRSGTSYDIYAQRIGPSGAVQWTPNGVAICTSANDQYSPTIIDDGSGGAVIVWSDYRNANANIYAQYVSSDGELLPAPTFGATVTSPVPEGLDYNLALTINSTSRMLTPPRLYQRPGGGVGFAAISGTFNSASSKYIFAIPAARLTSRGLDYYVVADDSIGNSARLPVSGVLSMRVSVSSVAALSPQPSGSEQTAYRLVSLPMDANNKDPHAVLGLGDYDNSRWRFYQLNPNQSYGELSENAISMTPGRAFWLILKDAGKTITTGAATSVSTERKFAIPLNKGWTFIANPFNFSIPFSKVTLKSGLPKLIYMRTTGWGPPIPDSIAPFSGYAIADTLLQDTLYVDPAVSIIPPASMPGDAVPAADQYSPALSSEPTKFSVQIQAKCGEAEDFANYISVSSSASSGLDDFDRPKPPEIGDFVSLSFPHPEWNSFFKNYSVDVRPDIGAGDAWTFEVHSNIHNRVKLTFVGVESVPGQYAVWLVDELLKTAQNLRSNTTYSMMSSGDPLKAHRLRFVVGTDPFVKQELNDYGTVPTSYALDQNFPNPFNPVTLIRYALPQRSQIVLTIYDVLGKEVATLVNEVQDAGFKVVEFDGSNLASGIYFYRVTMKGEGGSTFSDSRKLMLVK